MQKINFQNLPSTTTPINATNLNAIQSNAEDAINDVIDDLSDYVDGTNTMGNIVVEGIRTKNMFDKNNVIGAYLDTSGNPISNTDHSVSNYIDVSGMSNVTVSGNTGTGIVNCFYDSSKGFISAVTMSNNQATRTMEVPSNAKYIRVTVKNTVLNSYQLEEGSIATTYTPYQPIGTNTDSGWITLNSYIKYRKVNNIVYVVCDNNGFVNIPADSSYHAIGTLPTNYRPSIVIPFASHVYSVATKSIIGRVETNGNISIYTNVSIDYFGFFIAFPV